MSETTTHGDFLRGLSEGCDGPERSLLLDAADEIARLRAESAELRRQHDERDEELQQLDDLVVELGGEREQGPANFIGQMSHELSELKFQLAAAKRVAALSEAEMAVVAIVLSWRKKDLSLECGPNCGCLDCLADAADAVIALRAAGGETDAKTP